MLKTFNLEKGQPLTPDQMQEIEEARKSPIVFDEDAPELSPAMIKAFKCVVSQRNRRMAKQASSAESPIASQQ